MEARRRIKASFISPGKTQISFIPPEGTCEALFTIDIYFWVWFFSFFFLGNSGIEDSTWQRPILDQRVRRLLEKWEDEMESRRRASVKPGLMHLLGWRQNAVGLSGRFRCLEFTLQPTNLETRGIYECTIMTVVCLELEKVESLFPLNSVHPTWASTFLWSQCFCMFTASFLILTWAASTALCRGHQISTILRRAVCALTSCSHLMFHFKQKLLLYKRVYSNLRVMSRVCNCASLWLIFFSRVFWNYKGINTLSSS